MKRLATAIVAVCIFTAAWSNVGQKQKNHVETKNDDATRSETISLAKADKASKREAPKKVSKPNSKNKDAQNGSKKPVSSNNTCGPQNPTDIYKILRDIGVPRLSAIQLLGSWKTESGGDFNHCQKIGDGGRAWGLNSWHADRRYDMPQTLRGQVVWAVKTEMKRDCLSCYETVMAGDNVWSVREAIQRTTRWGIQGARWLYADEFANVF